MSRLSYEDARTAVERLGLTTAWAYAERYTEVPGLPSTLQKAYPEWSGWAAFLPTRTSRFLTFEDAVAAIHVLGIQG